MKKTIITAIVATATLFAADAPSNVDKRLAAEKSRREYFAMLANYQKAQQELNAKAAEVNGKIAELRSACKADEGFNDDDLTCTIKAAEAKPEPKK